MQRANWLLHPQKVFQDQIHLLQNLWQTCVSDGTEFHCHVHFNVSNHILQIVIWAQGNKSFMWPSQVNMGSDWPLQSHSDLLMREQGHFIQETPMFQMWILSTPQPHSLQLPLLCHLAVCREQIAHCIHKIFTGGIFQLSIARVTFHILSMLLKNAWTITFLHGTEP
jgi:hypothetical protein